MSTNDFAAYANKAFAYRNETGGYDNQPAIPARRGQKETLTVRLRDVDRRILNGYAHQLGTLSRSEAARRVLAEADVERGPGDIEESQRSPMALTLGDDDVKRLDTISQAWAVPRGVALSALLDDHTDVLTTAPNYVLNR